MRKPLAILSAAVLVLMAVAFVFGSLRWRAGSPVRAPTVVYDPSASYAKPNAGDGGGKEAPSLADGVGPLGPFANSYSADPATHEAAERLMAVDAEYMPEHVLVSFADGVTFDEASTLLSEAASLVHSDFSREEFDGGLVILDVADGCVVEDAVVELSKMELISIAQPNYVYHVVEDGSSCAAALRERLSSGLELGGADAASGRGTPSERSLVDGDLTPQTQAPSVTIDDFDGLDDSTRGSRSWHLTDVNAFSAWSYLQDESGIIDNDVCVAVIDDGFNVSNADLQANCKVTYNVTNKGANVSESSGHGTCVAGIVAAEANNGQGTAGVSYNADLALIKVADDSGIITTSYLYDAYAFVINNKDEYNIRVANASLGTSIQRKDGTILNISDDVACKKMEEAFESGVVPVVAAGNHDPKTDDDSSLYTTVPPFAEYPSDVPYAVSVINLARNRRRHSTSNYNYPGSSFKNVSAPGTDIYSTVGSGYGSKSGTSMASPLVAGVFSLAFAEKPELTAGEARAIAYCTASDLKYSGEGWDEQTGYGEIDALAMMECLNPTIDGPTALSCGQTARLALACGSDSASVAWSSSNPDVVSVDESGALEAKGAGEATVTATFTLSDRENDTYVDSAFLAIHVNDIYYAEASVPEQTYTGSALTPSPTVELNGTTLVAGCDYTVESYESNVDAGTATINLKGIGAYLGTRAVTFEIMPASISGATVTAASATYDYRLGYTATTVTVTLGGNVLAQGTDYALGDFSGNTGVGAGAGTVMVGGIGNYTGSASGTFDINPCDLTNADDVEVALTGTDGSSASRNPVAVVTLAGEALEGGVDYTTEFAYPFDTTGTCTVTFVGRFTGTRVVDFDRTPTSVASATVTGAEQTYTGGPLTTTVKVTLNGLTLVEGSDFRVDDYANNTNAGTATVTVRGMGKYTGTASGTFAIAARDIGAATVTAANQSWTGSPLTPAPTVVLGGRTLVSGTDYSVAFSNNVNAGTATVTATGRGNYTGRARGAFQVIAPAPAPEPVPETEPDAGVAMQRLYNPNSGEHFYTASKIERDALVAAGWGYEGVGWTAPSEGDPVFRLYNAFAGDHHYTTSAGERDALVAVGWSYEGEGWHSGGDAPLLRQYNPYAVTGSHNYTMSEVERDMLVSVGWVDEGVGWHGLG